MSTEPEAVEPKSVHEPPATHPFVVVALLCVVALLLAWKVM